MKDFEDWLEQMAAAGVTVRCTHCPLCQREPDLIISPEQAFCGNDDCRVLSWDMTEHIDNLLLNPAFVNLSEREP